jgi:hypothetical protein
MGGGPKAKTIVKNIFSGRRAKILTEVLLVVIVVALALIFLNWPRKIVVEKSAGAVEISLLGVRPDGGDVFLDAYGRPMESDMKLYAGRHVWGSDSLQRDFLFELPRTKEPMDFCAFQRIRVSGANRGLGSSQNTRVFDYGGREFVFFSASLPRFYRGRNSLLFKGRQKRVKRIDVTLRYFHGPRGKADFSFSGPFVPGETVNADGGLPYTLTPKVPNMSYRYNEVHLSTKRQVDHDIPVIAYDDSGRRYLGHGASGTTSSTGSEIDFQWVYEAMPWEKITAITFGERPHENTFRNIVVHYPDRPPRDHAAWVDEMVKRLDWEDKRIDRLPSGFEAAEEAIKVIDIIRGIYIANCHMAIRRKHIIEAPPETQEKIRAAAHTWLECMDLRIRAAGAEIGLEGRWPEFFQPALALLDTDDEEVRRRIAYTLRANYRSFSSAQLEAIKEIVMTKDDPVTSLHLVACLTWYGADVSSDDLLELAIDERPWLWWPAVQRLASRRELEPIASLSDELKLRLYLTMGPGWGRGNDADEESADTLLAELLTPEILRMNSAVFSQILEKAANDLDHEDATHAIVDFLESLDFFDYRRATWVVDRMVKYINLWYGVDIAGLGTDVMHDPEDMYGRDWRAIAAEAIEWYKTQLAAPAAEGTDAADRTGAAASESGTIDLSLGADGRAEGEAE